MDKLKRTLLIALISTSGAAWAASQAFQADMMDAIMAPYSPLSVPLFVAVWTAGMAAMMFPAISPVVLLYNRLVRNGEAGATLVIEGGREQYSIKMILFIGCYLVVWALTGLALLLGWSLLLNSAVTSVGLPDTIYGAILVATGAYQFSPLKAKCLGYCESPMSFFLRRWRNGTVGALTMGTYHGLYCLGCCWPYFLLMVALGWMDIRWMALFAAIIFGEKTWSRGIWVARAAGIGLAVAGVIIALGIVDISGDHNAMKDQEMPAVQESNPSRQQMDTEMPEHGEDQMSAGGMSGLDM